MINTKGYRQTCSDYNMEFYLDQLNELLDYLEIKIYFMVHQ